MDMYVMGKCPWCATAMEAIADLIKYPLPYRTLS